MSRLDINSNTTHTVSSGTTEEWLGADIDGSLDLQGSLKLIDDPDTPTSDGGGGGVVVDDPAVQLPLGIDLPSGPLNIAAMTTGSSILLIGLVAVLGSFSAVLENYAAGIAVLLAVVALILSGLVNLPLEIFYSLLTGAAILLAAGVAVRWSGATV